MVAATAIRFGLDPLLGDRAPFLLFVLAVLMAGAWLSLRSAIATAVAGGVAGLFFFVPPRLSLFPIDADGITALLVYGVVCAAGVALVIRIDQRRSEMDRREARHASEAREQRLIDAAQDYAIYELDREGRIVTWNKGAERLKGWKAEEVIGKPYNVLHTPESRAKNAPGRELKIAAETGRFEEEAPRMRKDGSVFAAHVSLFPLRDKNGEVTGFVKVTRDISDRTKAGKAILESRRRMEAIVQSAMDAIITIDEELRVVVFNPAAERIFGYAADEVLGQPVTTLFPQRFRGAHVDFLRDFFGRGRLNRRIEGDDLLVAERSSGEEFPIEASISQVTVDGERVGTVILRDITERKTNEEARALLAREVDHRAKNALAVAQALVGLTKADTVDEFADAIRGRIASLARAHTLLSQSQWRGAPLDQLIRDELLSYTREAQFDLHGPQLSCQPGAVQSLSLLFHELATNAVKYGALGNEGGHVSIDWRFADDTLLVRWEERDGPPVSPPRREGFGTKLLKQVTGRQLDAQLHFDWDPKGLEVEIRFPEDLFAVPPAETPSEAKARKDSGRPAKSESDRRILLVEDEELVALELSSELSRLGWAIVGPAATLSEAQSLLSKPFDAAVLDVNLRGRPIYPVAEALEERHVPFLFCTGYEMVDPEGRFPGVPVIRKPVRPATVSAALSELLKAKAN